MASHFSICFLLFILAYFVTYSSAAVASWQEEFEMKMEAKMNKMETKNIQLEGKVTQLEAQLEFNNEIRKDLTLKVTRLEEKVQEQEKILNFLLQANELPISPTGSKSISANNRQNVIQSSGKSGFPRTCRELRASNPSLASGMQFIDPDGQGIGDDPIYVFCDMSTGSTSILHDSESPIDVGHCTDPGCYSRFINYNASSKQMKSLADLSTECHQSIKYDCNFAPFEFDKVPYAWWNDRDGNAQYFWSGNNTDGIHTCQCGIDGNCVDPALKCNCDSAAPIQLVDDGVITDKNILPVTQLNFGRTQLATSSGVHTLGRLVCSGSVTLNGFPTSCEDLWLIGHTLNGFYSIKGEKMIESVYCDFTQLPGNENFQKWIGYTDVKSTPVHFYVQRESSFSTLSTPIPWDVERVNEGNAMNLTSGKFTAPRPGIYFFSFTGTASFPASSSSRIYLGVCLFLNGGRIGLGDVRELNTVPNQFSPLTVQSTLNLTKDDQVWVEIFWQSTGVYLFDDIYHYTHFTGFMLEEEIVASL